MSAAGAGPRLAARSRRLAVSPTVAVVPGEGFHAPGFFRLSFAAPRIAAFLVEHAPGGRRPR